MSAATVDYPEEEECRIDPEDGLVRTLPELQTLYAQVYTPTEIEDYWSSTCQPVRGSKPDEGDDEGPVSRRASENTNPVSRPATEATDPFLMQGLPEQGYGATGGALLTGHSTGDAETPARAPAKVSTQTIEWNAYLFGPWLAFVYMLMVWSFLQHYSWSACVLLTGLLIAMCVAMLALVSGGVRHCGPVSLLPLGILCLSAAVLGTLFGNDVLWAYHWRHYWWLQTGRHVDGTSAATPAASRADAAVLSFRDEATGGTVNGTLVDHLKSAGFKDLHYYCVAPLISADQAGAAYTMVNYWAVGTDCCQQLGSFTCDASRDPDGGYGIVLLPCQGPECHNEEFAAAVKKAEHEHGLLSAEGARFVRWVKDVSAEERSILVGAIMRLLLIMVLAFGVSSISAGIAVVYSQANGEPVLGPMLGRQIPSSISSQIDTKRREAGLAMLVP